MLSSRKAVLVGALLAGTTGILFAQASGLTRTMLGKADLSAPGREAVVAVGATQTEADELIEDVRRRDAERFDVEATGGIFAGRALILGNAEQKGQR